MKRKRQAKKTPALHFVAAKTPEAQIAKKRLAKLYGDAAADEADIIVALGGDGVMLRALHKYIDLRTPIYGMHRGSIGFLMNEYNEKNLFERLAHAETATIHPLIMSAVDRKGNKHKARAINEVSLLRQTYQAAKLCITVDKKVRLKELVSDGVLVATAAGSTAYNFSAHGPILPIRAQLLALTPLSPFRPRRWRGALLPADAAVTIDVLDANERPVSAAADHMEVRNVQRVTIRQDKKTAIPLLFDAGHSLDERVLREQFYT
jgi:NAD+ kinase